MEDSQVIFLLFVAAPFRHIFFFQPECFYEIIPRFAEIGETGHSINCRIIPKRRDRARFGAFVRNGIQKFTIIPGGSKGETVDGGVTQELLLVLKNHDFFVGIIDRTFLCFVPTEGRDSGTKDFPCHPIVFPIAVKQKEKAVQSRSPSSVFKHLIFLSGRRAAQYVAKVMSDFFEVFLSAQGAAPSFGDSVVSVYKPRKTSRDRADRIGVRSEIYRLQNAIAVIIRREDAPHGGFERVYDIAAAFDLFP